MLILAIDPGDTIGCALIQVPKDKPAVVESCWEETFTGVASVKSIWAAGAAGLDLLIIEDWQDRYGYAEARNTCRAIGMFETLADRFAVPVRFQPPAFRANIADTKKDLEPLGYWYPNLKAHDDRRQAMRHGLSYTTMKLLHRPTMELIHPRPTA